MRIEDEDEYKYIAQHYDLLLRSLLKPLRNAVCRIAQRERFENILDLCCGTGELCVMLSRLGLRVSGVDLSPAMLGAARRKSPDSIAYFEENAAALHFEDNTFDCVIISLALHEKDRDARSAILREAGRVLEKGGRFLLADYLLPMSLRAKIGHMAVARVERFAGESHYNCYREYMRRGALQALVRDLDAEALSSACFFLETTGLYLLRRRN